jgi:hypothetical protein
MVGMQDTSTGIASRIVGNYVKIHGFIFVQK